MYRSEDSSGPKEQYIRWRCTLAPPSEYGGLTFSVVAMRPVSFIAIATFSLLASCDLSVLPSSALLYGGKVIGPTPEAATQGFAEWWHTACDSDFIEHIDYNMTSCWSADFALANLRFFRGGGWLWEPEQVKRVSIAGVWAYGRIEFEHLWVMTWAWLHTHPFNGPFSGTTRVGRYQKDKTNLDFTEARDSEWQWHQLGHMQVCTLLQTDNHASTSPLSVPITVLLLNLGWFL